jgi:hypothetical protein
MMVKVLKASYLQDLREEAVKAYKDTLQLKASQKRDAMLIKDSEVAVFGTHAPSESALFDNWFSQLKVKNEEARVLRCEYEASVEAMKDDEVICSSLEYKWFVSRYEEKNYHPQEEDYEEVEVPDKKRVSHATQAVDGLVIGET